MRRRRYPYRILRRVLADPLPHFLLIGTIVFGAVDWWSTDVDRRDVVVISEGQVQRLAESFERRWMRPPNRDELSRQLEEHIRDELLYREALALGLDRNDPIVRRRMAQKLEFLALEITPREPTGTDLEGYFHDNPGLFRTPPLYSFQQIFFDPAATGSADARARAALQRLLRTSDPVEGDATLLPHRLEAVSRKRIADEFGEAFASAIAELPAGTWGGPVTSVFGFHLVRVDEIRPARLPDLAEVVAAVRREYEASERDKALRALHTSLRDRYRVELPSLGEFMESE